MRTWIFQGNPDHFDIDGYLASQPARFVWLVRRYAEDMRLGDRVFIWRNAGSQRANAGVVAEAEIIGLPEPRAEEPDALPYWRSDADGRDDIVSRARLRLVRVASSRETLRREWCLDDPVLRELPNIKQAAGTNYPIEHPQAERLAALWSRTGRDWTRNESVAGLWAYAKAYGQQVSRLPGSPVAETAMALGRAVTGVYNKVMNFRSIDPRETRKGMSGSGEVDRRVWEEFYDETLGVLRPEPLEREYDRLWRSASAPDEPPSELGNEDVVLEDRARKLVERGLEYLLDKYRAEREARPERPETRNAVTRLYERDPYVVAIAKLRASHRCEIPDCSHPIFLCADGTPYAEVHHIEPLSEGGKDVIENVACLCASHHREIHFGHRAAELISALRNRAGGGGL